MTCREFVEVVTEYLEGALPASDVVRFERHFEECEHCGRYFEQMRVTIRVLNRLDD